MLFCHFIPRVAQRRLSCCATSLSSQAIIILRLCRSACLSHLGHDLALIVLSSLSAYEFRNLVLIAQIMLILRRHTANAGNCGNAFASGKE
jgi:hypothetical protein